MSRRHWQSPTQSVLSPIKSEGGNTTTILSQLFSQQFLGCLKDELTSKLKETKSVESLYKQTLLQLKICKKQLEKLKKRNEELTLSKKRMAAQLNLLQSGELGEQEQPKIIVRAVSVQVEGGDEIRRLRERLQRLQISKSIKQQRVNELLQQTARVDTALKVLLVKNDELQEEVKSLRLTVVVQGEEKALLRTINSEKDPEIALSYHFSAGGPLNQPALLQPAGKTSSDLSLIASFTNNIKIPQSLELSRACLKRLPFASPKEYLEINEIDDIISEELPYLNVTTELNAGLVSPPSEPVQPTINLNESVVLINLNH